MKVSLAKHGGLAGGTLLGRPAHTLDTEALPREKEEELEQLVSAALMNPSPAETDRGRARDAMSYTITVTDGEEQVLTQSDAGMSPAFDALRNWLEKHFKSGG